MPPKHDKVRKVKRLLAVENAMALGMGCREIQARISREFNCTERTIRNDIVKVEKQWAVESEAEAPHRRHQTRMLLRRIIQKAMADKQYGAATSAAGRLMDLDGLKIVKVEHSGGISHTVADMTSDDKRRKLNELMERADQRRAEMVAKNAKKYGKANGKSSGANGSNGATH